MRPTARSAVLLIVGWVAVSAAAFAVSGATQGGGVLDVPIGALLAMQGALIGFVLLGVWLRNS